MDTGLRQYDDELETASYWRRPVSMKLLSLELQKIQLVKSVVKFHQFEKYT